MGLHDACARRPTHRFFPYLLLRRALFVASNSNPSELNERIRFSIASALSVPSSVSFRKDDVVGAVPRGIPGGGHS